MGQCAEDGAEQRAEELCVRERAVGGLDLDGREGHRAELSREMRAVEV